MICHAVSLGGVESLICQPASTTHSDACVTPEDKKIAGITDSLIRLRYDRERKGGVGGREGGREGIVKLIHGYYLILQCGSGELGRFN